MAGTLLARAAALAEGGFQELPIISRHAIKAGMPPASSQSIRPPALWHGLCRHTTGLQNLAMQISAHTPTSPTLPLHFLVAGGAGYIGSHMVKHLPRRGCDVVTFDNLSTGHRDAVPGGAFALEDLANVAAPDNLFKTGYFDAARADPEDQLGERHDPETHLIPLVLQAASGRRPHISIYGRDYDTPDGTCIRDYIHVADLCDAHWLALQKLLSGSNNTAYNLGNGQGFSVRKVIDTTLEITGREIKVVDALRRAGDPARLVADATLARAELVWQPSRFELKTIVEDAWQWEEKIADLSKHAY